MIDLTVEFQQIMKHTKQMFYYIDLILAIANLPVKEIFVNSEWDLKMKSSQTNTFN